MPHHSYFFLTLALIVCPLFFFILLSHLRRNQVEKPPIASLFLLFGTIGGWLLAFALAPSGLSAISIVLLTTIAPLALLISSLLLSSLKKKTIYHKIPMWFGFAYLFSLSLVLTLTAVTQSL